MFISIDGIDGAGKSTQLERLCGWLASKQYDVEFVRDPGSTPAGEAIRGLLLDSDLEMHRRCEALLYMAARSQLVEARIRPALTQGKVVVSDRYLLANVVYQSVGGETQPDLLWQLGRIATDGIYPDLTILLDLTAEEAASRRAGPADRMERRGIEYMQHVRDAFLAQLSRCPGNSMVVDAGRDVESVWTDVQRCVESILKTTEDS
ncbi:MAG: dTMP kinase [Pirellulaceae bacterium]